MAVYYQIAGTQLALPDYARVDLAFSFTTDVMEFAPGDFLFYPITGDYIELPVSLFADYITTAALGDRTVFVQTKDENALVNSLSVAPTTQPPSSARDYAFNVGLPFSYGPVGSIMQVGMPVIALLPGFVFELTTQNGDAGDIFDRVSLTTVRIPTGPQLADSTTPLATPVLA